MVPNCMFNIMCVFFFLSKILFDAVSHIAMHSQTGSLQINLSKFSLVTVEKNQSVGLLSIRVCFISVYNTEQRTAKYWYSV